MLLVIFTNNMSLKHNSCFIFSYYTLFSGKKKGKELNIRAVFKAAIHTQDSVNSVTDFLDFNTGHNGAKILTRPSRGNENLQDPICVRNRTGLVVTFSIVLYCGCQKYIQRLLFLHYILNMWNCPIMSEHYFPCEFLSRKYL